MQRMLRIFISIF